MHSTILTIRKPMSQIQAQSFTSLSDVLQALWQNKIKLVLGFIFGALMGAAIAYSMPEMYRSQAILFPSSSSSGSNLGGLAGQIGGLASIAGVDLGEDQNDNTTLAIEILNSHKFIIEFINNNDLSVPLFAYKGFDFKGNEALIDNSVYDEIKGEWHRKPDVLGSKKPNDFQLVKEFRNQFDVSQDKVTGMITVTFDNPSPQVAQLVVQKLVASVNKSVRERDIDQAEKSIEYLRAELANTSVFEMRKMFSQLIEEQTSKLLLAKVKTDYVFETVDPPLSTLKPNTPNKPLIIIVMSFIGLIMMASYILIFRMPKKHV